MYHGRKGPYHIVSGLVCEHIMGMVSHHSIRCWWWALCPWPLSKHNPFLSPLLLHICNCVLNGLLIRIVVGTLTILTRVCWIINYFWGFHFDKWYIFPNISSHSLLPSKIYILWVFFSLKINIKIILIGLKTRLNRTPPKGVNFYKWYNYLHPN